ncbi:helix-turn-helix transcriptional regulator [Nocardioides sp.]|nr:helix-turn-helix transcriptional regulator [Nocardioides sp.]
MLSLLTGTAMSAAEVARELDTTHANASYHLRVLLDAGLIVVEGEERIRGGVAKRYRYLVGEGPAQSEADLAAEVEVIAQELVRRHREGAQAPRVIADAELWLAPETWQQVVDLLKQASRLMHEGALPPRTDGAVKANLSLAAFRMS